jgi:hypothetical protein
MSSTYLVRNATTTNVVGTSGQTVSPNFIYGNTIYFNAFSLLASGLLAGLIARVVLRIYVASIEGTKAYQPWWGTDGNNWTPTLTADATDFGSTHVTQDGEFQPLSTGWVEVDLTLSNLNLNGDNYLSISPAEFNAGTNANITINSSNNASNKPHLRFYLKGGSAVGLRTLARRLGNQWIHSSGGGGGGFLDFYGITADGSVTRSETVPIGDPPTPRS